MQIFDDSNLFMAIFFLWLSFVSNSIIIIVSKVMQSLHYSAKTSQQYYIYGSALSKKWQKEQCFCRVSSRP